MLSVTQVPFASDAPLRTPTGPGRPYPPEIVAAVRALVVGAGLSYREAAARTGLREDTVGHWARRFGWRRAGRGGAVIEAGEPPRRHAEEPAPRASRSTQDGGACFEMPAARAPQHVGVDGPRRHRLCQTGRCLFRTERRPSAMEISTIGLDLAKSVFQVHGVDREGGVAVQRRLKRAEVERFFARLGPTLIGIEACGSAHYWGRVLQAQGHDVRLMPPNYVKPYVRRNKTDARDAEAICEAVTRPTMRFVPVKSAAMQAGRGMHRVRDLLVRQRSQIGNCLRGLAAEFGLVAREGQAGLASLRERIAADDVPIPEPLREALAGLARQWTTLDDSVGELDRRIAGAAQADPTARRLMGIPGIGPITAHALVSSVPDAKLFGSGRDFAAWLGLTPRQASSGTRQRSGAISRAGDGTLRRLLVLGAATLVRHARSRPQSRPWLTGLLGRRPVKVAVVAQAAKTARIVWALMARGDTYEARPVAA